MGVLDDIKQRLLADLDQAKDHLLAQGLTDAKDLAMGDSSAKNDQFVLLGRSIGKVMGFQILTAREIGYPNMEMTFTDRGLYFFNGKAIWGGTNATYRGFLDENLVFYGQGNGMSVAETDPRTYSTWFTEGVAQLEPNLTGAGTYRGSILYRWVDGPFAELNPVPAIFELVIDNWGITQGTIWRWVVPTTSNGSDDTASSGSNAAQPSSASE